MTTWRVCHGFHLLSVVYLCLVLDGIIRVESFHGFGVLLILLIRGIEGLMMRLMVGIVVIGGL